MFGTFICKKCRHELTLNFDNPHLVPMVCTNCSHRFEGYNYLFDFVSKTSNVDVRLNDLEFLSLTKYISNDRYDPMVKEFHTIYAKSSSNTKDLLKAILEINYLIVEQATIRQDSEILSTYSKKLANVVKEISKIYLD